MSFLEKYKTKKLSQNGDFIQSDTPSGKNRALPNIYGPKDFTNDTNQHICLYYNYSSKKRMPLLIM